MHTINKVINKSRCKLAVKQQKLAINIDDELRNGKSFHTLHGQKVKALKAHIRFKLSRDVRLIYAVSSQGYYPVAIIPRKHLEHWIKRR